MKGSIYKRSKVKWNNEQEALADVCAKQNINDNLYSGHTEEYWVWRTSISFATAENANEYSVAKNEVSEQEAKQFAMEHLQTFENNLQANHTDENWVFKKIRG